ncbi:hypothetical protein JXA84_09900 [candidate division WOR-3 bacterium]|nr:hypothetical protein [candidate division WOR-3 bacterium]
MPSNIFQRLSVILKDKQKKTLFNKYFKEETESAFAYKVDVQQDGLIPDIQKESQNSEFMTTPIDEIAKKVGGEVRIDSQDSSQNEDIFGSFGTGIREIKFEDTQSDN